MSKTTNKQAARGDDKPSFGSLNNLLAYGRKAIKRMGACAVTVECRLCGVDLYVWTDGERAKVI